MNALALPYTGERVIPDRFAITDRILQEHLARYSFAARMIQPSLRERQSEDKPIIIDAPCGSGYGAWLLATSTGASVYGYDIDAPTIEYARVRYPSGEDEQVCFMQADLDSPMSLPDADAVVCFEGIEHVQGQASVAQRLCDALRTDGMILVSTPRVHGPGAGSAFHTHEMTLSEFRELFTPHLSSVEMFGQEMRVGDCLPDENARYYVLVGRR